MEHLSLRKELNLSGEARICCFFLSIYLSIIIIIFDVLNWYILFFFLVIDHCFPWCCTQSWAPTLPSKLLQMYSFRPCHRIKNRGRGQQVEFEQVLLVILVLNKDYCHGPQFPFIHDSDVTYILLGMH